MTGSFAGPKEQFRYTRLQRDEMIRSLRKAGAKGDGRFLGRLIDMLEADVRAAAIDGTALPTQERTAASAARQLKELVAVIKDLRSRLYGLCDVAQWFLGEALPPKENELGEKETPILR